MEREFGAEIVRTFGARLRRIYDSDNHRLTERMVACLEQLERAEKPEAPVRIQSQSQQAGNDGSEGPQNGIFDSLADADVLISTAEPPL